MILRPSYHHSVFDLLASLVWCTIVIVAPCKGAVYDDVSRLFDDKLGPNSSYKTTIRPLYNQSDIIRVNVAFGVIAILDVNAISQEFIVNGFLALTWFDEVLAWDPLRYNDVLRIQPEPVQIWRPRLILFNTVDGRDLFEDNYSPLTTLYTGETTWSPGDLFPSSCKLNLYKYPFDEQECTITMVTIGWGTHELMFESLNGQLVTQEYHTSGEWTIEASSLETSNDTVPFFNIKFKIKRRPGFFIVNIVIPIVLMSFLNILVFLIPVDSGEKISYGITVLLALTVFMSIVSEQLPRSSDPIPAVTIYLLILNIISLCTVMVSIVIVLCHHREREETNKQKSATSFKSLLHKHKFVNHEAKRFSIQEQEITDMSASERPFSDLAAMKDGDNLFNVSKELKGNSDIFSPDKILKDRPEEDHGNRWRHIGNRLDLISFIVFPLIWISITISFLMEIAG